MTTQGEVVKAHKLPMISVALNAFGTLAVLSAMLFLAGSFTIGNELGRAFCLGAFFSGLIGAILLFGFSKVIDLLDQIREQTEAVAGEFREVVAESERAHPK